MMRSSGEIRNFLLQRAVVYDSINFYFGNKVLFQWVCGLSAWEECVLEVYIFCHMDEQILSHKLADHQQ